MSLSPMLSVKLNTEFCQQHPAGELILQMLADNVSVVLGLEVTHLELVQECASSKRPLPTFLINSVYASIYYNFLVNNL